MNELDKLKPEVAAAIRTMSDEAGGNRDDAYDVIEAELLRLMEENAQLSSYLETLTARCVEETAALGRAESELAEIKRRVAESPVVECPLDKPKTEDGWVQVIEWAKGVNWTKGKRVRLLLDDGESA